MNFRAFAWSMLILASSPALAEEAFKPSPAQRDACLPDVRKFCKEKPPAGLDELGVQSFYQACLNQHRDFARRDHISQKCQDLFTEYGR
jgi:hypothetical protein